LKEVLAALASADPGVLAAKVQAGEMVKLPCPEGPVTLEPADLQVTSRAPEGWAGVSDRGTEVVVDIRVTEELKREGLARDVVRQVQELRRKASLEMEDRIVLHLGTESAILREAIETHWAYISGETLAVERAMQPLGAGAHQAKIKVDGQALTIQLRKV
jgi:isoleucyl-tRNA synthetase